MPAHHTATRDVSSAAVASPLVIRPATPSDAERIGVIYDEGISGGAATFATGPHSAEERRVWLAERSPRAPVFCATADGRVVGWSALAPFSQRPWYDGVAEYTAYVAHDARGTGVGRRLLQHLIDVAAEFDYWKLVGMILADNHAGLALATGSGFRVVGTYAAHGRIGQAWRDVTVVERHLMVGPGASR
jgi:L-amino acid N-acyltransferase YncA